MLEFEVLLIQNGCFLLEVDVGVQLVGLNVDVVVFRWLLFLLRSLVIGIFLKESLFHLKFKRGVVKDCLVKSC